MKKRSEKDFKEDEIFKGQANNGFYHYPCYSDVNDKSTLRWYYIYRKPV